MNEAQKAAALKWLDDWAAPMIAGASVFTRGAYQAFMSQHRDELAEGIGNAVLSVSTEEK